jgi:hypothetical protein
VRCKTSSINSCKLTDTSICLTHSRDKKNKKNKYKIANRATDGVTEAIDPSGDADSEDEYGKLYVCLQYRFHFNPFLGSH